MKAGRFMTVAAVLAATTVVSFSLASCQGRKMDNMQPKGETVEVDVMSAPETDSVEITGPVIEEAVEISKTGHNHR